MKDNFSTISGEYARCRPGYPGELFSYLASICQQRKRAWDCATGNGQAAWALSALFEEVHASDMSVNQLAQAKPAANIHYALEHAEHTSYADAFFDLVVVAQAIHWFGFDDFYKEVRRTAAEGAHLAVLGYGLPQVDKKCDAIVMKLYEGILKEYWDPERRYIDEAYKTIPFPFTEIKTPEFENKLHWTSDHFLDFLRTWSAVNHFKDRQAHDPVSLIESELRQCWGGGEQEVCFPLLLRVGKV